MISESGIAMTADEMTIDDEMMIIDEAMTGAEGTTAVAIAETINDAEEGTTTPMGRSDIEWWKDHQML